MAGEIDSSETVFGRELGIDPFSVKALLDTNNFNKLRVVDIKNILKYYRDNASIAISLTANKASLVAVLSRIAPRFRESEKDATLRTIKSSSASPVGQNFPCRQPHLQPQPMHVAAAPHPVHRPYAIENSSISSSHRYDPIPSPDPMPHTSVPSSPQGGSGQFFPSSKVPPFVNTMMRNPANQAVYQELRAASFPAERIHRCLADMYLPNPGVGSAVIDFDTMICAMMADVDNDEVSGGQCRVPGGEGALLI